MKKLILPLFILLTSCSAQHFGALSPNASNQLHTQSLPMAAIVESVSPDASAVQSVSWVNTGNPVYVVGYDVWVGADGGNVSDINVLLRNITDGDTYLSTNWDHYIQSLVGPGSIQSNLYSKDIPAPYYFLVRPGDTVQLTIAGTSYLSTSRDVGSSALLRVVQ